MLENLHQVVNVLKVLLIVEEDEVSLPELLSVDRRPAEVLAADLGTPLIK